MPEVMGEENPNYGVFPSSKKASRFRELSEKAMNGGLSVNELNEWTRLYVLAKGLLPDEMELRRGRLVYKDTGKQVIPVEVRKTGRLGKAKVYKVKK